MYLITNLTKPINDNYRLQLWSANWESRQLGKLRSFQGWTAPCPNDFRRQSEAERLFQPTGWSFGDGWRWFSMLKQPLLNIERPKNFWLVVWNMVFMIFHILGIIIPINFYMFQRGWNHQPDLVLQKIRKWMSTKTRDILSGKIVWKMEDFPLAS